MKHGKRLLALGMAMWFLAALHQLDRGQADAAKAQLEEALTRAAVACYAAEGAYPQDVAVLQERYGVRIDEERYTVIYDAFAENLMPDITVLENER